MDIGRKIAELRKTNGVSQQSLADYLFVSRDLISKWENGSRRPNYSMIERIANFFNVPADLIFSKDDAVIEELSECLPNDVDVAEDDLNVLIEEFLTKINNNEAIVFINRYYYLKSTA
ncbi:MAG: helix-turn-helix transcriptional regulator, partial [Clostridia bacterium]|nr:helix-turn-helix transcriptional regulator [Clostridia bacterium]